MPADIPGGAALSRLAHDRAGERRGDDAWLAQAWPAARVILITTRGLAAVRGGVLDTPTGAMAEQIAGRVRDDWPGRIFLGLAGEQAWFALVVDAAEGTAEPPNGAQWGNLRDIGATLDDLDVGLFTCAAALVAWHGRNRFCPNCGAPTEPRQAGWTRQCTREGTDVFPRTDPAVIMLVHDGGERCVLGRQATWPPGRFSILAGFVEAGEPLEAAVVREVAEEVGLPVAQVRYIASQPWPFPQSLMIGCTARALAQELAPQDDEIAEAYWFSKAEVAAAATWDAVNDDTPGVGPGGVLKGLPGPVSIARQLLDAWVAGRL